MPTISVERVHELALRALRAHGSGLRQAEAVARIVAAAERDGCRAHGLHRVPGYVESLRSGLANPEPEPTVERLSAAVVRVRGDRGFAPLALDAGRQPTIDAARRHGVAALAVNDARHFHALWADVEPYAEAGLAALAFTANYPYVAPAAGMRAVYGTNPMAFGWPRPGRSPLVWDQSSSARSRGDLEIASRDGEALPLGVGVDARGEPTTEPRRVLDGGAQLPFGGFKGGNVALMVELLAGPLIGDRLSAEALSDDGGRADRGPPIGGELLVVVEPSVFWGREGARGSARGAERLFAHLAAEAAGGSSEWRLPGARREAARRAALTGGVEVEPALYRAVCGLGAGGGP